RPPHEGDPVAAQDGPRGPEAGGCGRDDRDRGDHGLGGGHAPTIRRTHGLRQAGGTRRTGRIRRRTRRPAEGGAVSQDQQPTGAPGQTDPAGHADSAGRTATAKEPILSVKDLSVRFWVGDEWFTAAEGLTYDLHPGEVLAIVGESGSGKSQSSMSLMGLLPRNGRASGSARLGHRELVGL